MSFTNPLALGLLGLAIPIVWVHFYRGPLRPISVPSLMLWETVLVEDDQKSALRRIRHYLSLILNLTALLLVVALLAGPRIEGWSHAPRRVAFVINSTLPMSAGTRMRDAQQYVRSYLTSLHPTDSAALYDSEGLLVPFTTDRRRVLAALSRRPRWTLANFDVKQVLKETAPDAEIVSVDGWGAFSNGAITGIRREGDRILVSAGQEQSGPGATLSLKADGEPVGTLELAGDVKEEHSFPMPKAVLVRAARSPADAYSLDDAGFLVAPSVDRPWVAVFHEGEPSPFLMTALKRLQELGHIHEWREWPMGKYLEIRDELDASSLIIVLGGRLEEMGAGVFACFGTESSEWTTRGESGEIQVTDWDASHPALQAINPSVIAIRESRILSGGRTLLRSTKGPIAVSGGGPGRAWVSFGFRLEEKVTDIGVRAALPLLVRNLVEWTRSGASRTFPLEVESGDLLTNRYPLVPEQGQAILEWTDGYREMRQQISYQNGQLRQRLVLPGFYRVQAGTLREWVAVPVAPPELGQFSNAREHPDPPPAREWYEDISFPWIAGPFLMLLLLAEWVLYQKKLI